MPALKTLHFGDLTYPQEAVIEFPAGLPAFESERRFVLVEQEATAPVVFLQSLARSDLVFLTLPVDQITPDYPLQVSEEDLARLGLATGSSLEIGADIQVLAILTIGADGSVTANLMAPILIHLASRRACQAIQPDSGYSHQHCLRPPAASEPSC